MPGSSTAPLDKTTAVIGGLGALVLVLGFVVLTAIGRDTTSYVIFVSGPLVSTLVGLVLSRKVSAVQATADEVKVATNGILGARLNSLDDQLAAASDERTAIATAAPATPAAHRAGS